MLRKQDEYEIFIRLEYLYRGFLEAFEEEIGDIYDYYQEPTSYSYNFSNKKSHVRILETKKLDEFNRNLFFEVDFNSDFSNFRRCHTTQSRWYRYLEWENDVDYRYDNEPPEIINKFKWLLEHKKLNNRKRILFDGNEKIPSFSSVCIKIWGNYDSFSKTNSPSYKRMKWYVCVLSHRMEVDLDNVNLGRDVFDFFKKVLCSISLLSK